MDTPSPSIIHPPLSPLQPVAPRPRSRRRRAASLVVVVGLAVGVFGAGIGAGIGLDRTGLLGGPGTLSSKAGVASVNPTRDAPGLTRVVHFH